MTKVRISVVAVFLLLAFGTMAFAASNSTTINLTSPTSVAGTKLDPGTYKVSWTGEGDHLTVVFKGNKSEVKAQGATVKNDAPMSSTSFVTNKEGEISEIRPGGKNTAVKITNTQNASMNTGSSSSQ
jgi:hypothetical protein